MIPITTAQLTTRVYTAMSTFRVLTSMLYTLVSHTAWLIAVLCYSILQIALVGSRAVLHAAGHKRLEKRICCCNFVNIVSIKPNFCRDIEHIILTNLFFFVFGIVTFWRENNVANFAPKKLNNR